MNVLSDVLRVQKVYCNIHFGAPLVQIPSSTPHGQHGSRLCTNCQDNDNRQVQDKAVRGERSWLILHLLQRQQTINLFVSRTHWQGMWASLGLAPATVGSEVRGESFVELHLLWLPQRDSILRELWTATRFWQINLRLSRWAAGTNKFLLAQLKEARHMPQFSN